MKPIRFSQHALEKFDLLEKHGFKINMDDVTTTIGSPDKVEKEHYPFIAQRQVSANTVLRVAYTEDTESITIITFYPGDRKRYED